MQPSLATQGSALLVIDAQKDSLVQGGAFSVRHCDTGQLVQTLVWLVRAARLQGRAVGWITSSYGELQGDPEGGRGQAHQGAPFCVRGTWGAELVGPLRAVQEERPGPGAEWRIEKRGYSAFRDTPLQARLEEARISRVILCGVATDVCVMAAAREARRLGYEVDVVRDATAAGTSSKHVRALREMEAMGVRVRRFGDLLSEGEALPVEGLGAGGTALWCGALRSSVAEGSSTFDAIEREVAWSSMLHRGGEVPRRVALQGTLGPDGALPLYRHPMDEQPELRGWTPAVDAVRRAVQERVGHPLNHGLLQLYRGGRDWISEHSDKTLDLVPGSSIVNVSLGRMRTMVLRPKRGSGQDARIQKIPLPHGSFLVMDRETNRAFYHAIRQEGASSDDGPRISLTFRYIGTWWSPATGAVWGVGARVSGREEAEARALARRALPPEASLAEERQEASRLLGLFREENLDPSFDAASYSPGFDVLDLRSLNGPP